MDGRRLASCVYTFHQPPSALFRGDAGELCSPAQKKQVLQSMGVEELVQADFSAVRELSPEQFVEEVLHGLLDAQLVSCGFNYRFGRGGSGDAAPAYKAVRPLGHSGGDGPGGRDRRPAGQLQPHPPFGGARGYAPGGPAAGTAPSAWIFPW